METLSQILGDFGVTWSKFLSQLILFIIVYTVLSKFAFPPIIAMLEERRKRIEQAQKDAAEIKRKLAEAEERHQEILDKANAEAQKMIDEARASSSALSEKKQQEAITQAESIVARAREATEREYEKMLAELKSEVGRLVVDTTAKVTGKVLTPEDQRRLSEETARQVAA